jgi:hypothetical protein
MFSIGWQDGLYLQVPRSKGAAGVFFNFPAVTQWRYLCHSGEFEKDRSRVPFECGIGNVVMEGLFPVFHHLLRPSGYLGGYRHGVDSVQS